MKRPIIAAIVLIAAAGLASAGSKAKTEAPLKEWIPFDNPKLLATLREIGYRGPVGLMCYGIPGDAREHLERSIKVWHSWEAGWAKE